MEKNDENGIAYAGDRKETTIANVQELGDVIARTLASVLGVLLPQQLAQPAGALIAPALENLAGITNMSGAVISTDMSAEGVWQHQKRKRDQSLADRVGKIVNDQARDQTIAEFMRAINPEDTWLEQNGYENNETGHAAYTRAINQKVADTISKKGIDFVYNAANEYLGINDAGTAGVYMGEMAKALSGQVNRTNPLRGASAGGYIAANMFMTPAQWTEDDLYEKDENGNFKNDGKGGRVRRAGTAGIQEGDYMFADDGSMLLRDKKYDAGEWGGHSQGAVAQLASHIAETTNLMDGVDTSVPAELSRAGDNIRNTVKAYANALQPLKDIFGNDMRRMIQTLEEFTGQSLAQSGINRINKLASQIASRKDAGYDIDGQYGLRGRTQKANDWINNNSEYITNGVMRGNAAGTALLGMDMERGGGIGGFGYYTNEQWAASAVDLANNMANSEGTEAVANGYGLWQQANKNKKDANGNPVDVSFQAYKQQLKEKMASGMGLNAAVMEVSGAENWTQLRAGAAFAGSADALQSGDAAAVTLEAGFVPQLREMAKIEVANDQSLQFALKQAGYNGDPTELLDMMDSLQEQDPTLFTMTDAEQRKARMIDRSGELSQAYKDIAEADAVLNNKDATDAQKAEAQQRKDAASARADTEMQRIEGLNAMMSYAFTNLDSALGEYGLVQQHAKGVDRAREAEAKASARREAGKKIYQAVNETGNGALMMELLESGGTAEGVKDVLGKRNIGLNGVELEAAAQIMSVADTYIAANKDDILEQFAKENGTSARKLKNLLEDGGKDFNSLKDGEKEMYKKLQKRFAQEYMTAYNGINDPRLLQSSTYVGLVEDASSADKSEEERHQAAELAMVYSKAGGAGAAALDKYLTEDQYDKNGRKLTDAEKRAELVNSADAVDVAVARNTYKDLLTKYESGGEDYKKDMAAETFDQFLSMRGNALNDENERKRLAKKGINITGDMSADFESWMKAQNVDSMPESKRAVFADIQKALDANAADKQGGDDTGAEPGDKQADQMGKLLSVLGELDGTLKTMNTTLAGISGETSGSRFTLLKIG